jgi:hypothetical protein
MSLAEAGEIEGHEAMNIEQYSAGIVKFLWAKSRHRAA